MKTEAHSASCSSLAAIYSPAGNGDDRQPEHHAQYELIELAEKIKKGQYKTGKLGRRKATNVGVVERGTRSLSR